MRNFFQRIGYSFSRFMYGRYGPDELSRFLSVVSLVFLAFSLIPHLHFFYLLAMALLIWLVFRLFSKNAVGRLKERSVYFKIKNSLKGHFNFFRLKFRDRKTHKYYRCPYCKAAVRISDPGHGRKISINCPKCRNSFIKKT